MRAAVRGGVGLRRTALSDDGEGGAGSGGVGADFGAAGGELGENRVGRNVAAERGKDGFGESHVGLAFAGETPILLEFERQREFGGDRFGQLGGERGQFFAGAGEDQTTQAALRFNGSPQRVPQANQGTDHCGTRGGTRNGTWGEAGRKSWRRTRSEVGPETRRLVMHLIRG